MSIQISSVCTLRRKINKQTRYVCMGNYTKSWVSEGSGSFRVRTPDSNRVSSSRSRVRTFFFYNGFLVPVATENLSCLCRHPLILFHSVRALLGDDWSSPKGGSTDRFHSSLKGSVKRCCLKQHKYTNGNVNLQVGTLSCHSFDPWSVPLDLFPLRMPARAGTHGSGVEVSFTVWARQWSENITK